MKASWEYIGTKYGNDPMLLSDEEFKKIRDELEEMYGEIDEDEFIPIYEAYKLEPGELIELPYNHNGAYVPYQKYIWCRTDDGELEFIQKIL